MMNNMGVELFELPWVNAITTFFGWLGWALFVVGLVVGAFECAIEYQGGRGSMKDTALNYIKGFMAVSLFFCTSHQSVFPQCVTTEFLWISIVWNYQHGKYRHDSTGGIDIGSSVGNGRSDCTDILCDHDGICSDKSIFRESEKRRNPCNSDCSREPLYVFCSQRIH